MVPLQALVHLSAESSSPRSRNSRPSSDSPAKCFQNRVRFLGSYDVRIVGTSRQSMGVGVGRMRRNRYHVQVSIAGADDVTSVKRRYSEFARLHALMKPRYADLPDMPPKSQFRKRVFGKFLDDRQEALNCFLGVVVALDPTIADPDLRHFLQTPTLLDPDVTRSGIFQCGDDDDDDDDESTFRGCCVNPDLAGDATIPGVFCAQEFDAESSESSDLDTESGVEVEMPGTMEIFERLGELRATNAVLEAENKAIIQGMSISPSS